MVRIIIKVHVLQYGGETVKGNGGIVPTTITLVMQSLVVVDKAVKQIKSFDGVKTLFAISVVIHSKSSRATNRHKLIEGPK